MTHSILLVVPKPNTGNYKDEQKWAVCIKNLPNLTTRNKDIEVLGENVLLLPLDQNLDAVSEIVPQLVGLPYKYIIFDEQIEWHEVSKKV